MKKYLLCCLILGISFVSAAGVRINEFLADNGGSHLTRAGLAEDWIELYNDGAEAVNLGGWFLTDKTKDLTQWRFPDDTWIQPFGYLLVFADSTGVSLVDGELHANFSLSKDGEYLALVMPDGATIASDFSPVFPAQYPDASYGMAPVDYAEWIGDATPMVYAVSVAAVASLPGSGVGGIGYSNAGNGFSVSYYRMKASVGSLAAAEAALLNSAAWMAGYPAEFSYETLNFYAGRTATRFVDSVQPFPQHSNLTQDINWFVIKAETSLYVPEAGAWTFCTASDDGFAFTISGHGVSFSSEYGTPHAYAETFSTFNFPEAGFYDFSLVHYENTGSAVLMVSVAKGDHETFNDAFRLLGSPDGGIVHAGKVATLIGTSVGGVMPGVATRVNMAWSFAVASVPDAEASVMLYLRVSDGAWATINDVPVAAVNIPETLAWNSTATASRANDVFDWLAFPVPVSTLKSGSNTLRITGLASSKTQDFFLVQPRLVCSSGMREAYFNPPTPGAENALAASPPTPIVVISEPRGYKTASFSASLSTPEAPGAAIYYTLDGSTPSLSNGTLYTTPLTISKTTTLRAASPVKNTIRQNTATATWIFLADALRQSATRPTGWPASAAINSQKMTYGMSAAILAADETRLSQGMTNAIPTISLVTDLANLFNAQTGIYVNAKNDGRGWERPVSIELIDPVRGTSGEFHIDGGLRVRGGYSRSANNPKHSFRLFFRSEYGDSKLRFPLFEDEGVSEFDKVDLRTEQNYSWSFPTNDADSNKTTFAREVFSRDSQRDMGMPYTRSRYYHLFLNGLYWGLYQTQERGDGDFAAAYIGGKKDDWDVIKTGTDYVTEGFAEAFHALHEIAVNQGFTGQYAANYPRAKGLNPDGTPNPDYPCYLDEENLMVYMLTAWYTGDPDCPIGWGSGNPNNMYGVFNRVTPGGFKWLRHDGEHSLGAKDLYPVTGSTISLGKNLTDQAKFNPATLHHRLLLHPDYRMRFSDLVWRHCIKEGGALTPEAAQARVRSRMSEIDTAIVAESARWGNGKTRDAHWIPACNSLTENYLAQRRDIFIAQLRTEGFYPAIEPPALTVSGDNLILTSSTPFYYTTDGSDPRAPGGSTASGAVAVGENQPLISAGSTWRYYDAGQTPPAVSGNTWKDLAFADSAWTSGPAILGFAGSTPVNTVATQTKRYVNGSSGTQVTTTYFRHAFTYAKNPGVENPQLKINMLRDDGVVVYLNGTEILRDNMPSGTITYGTYASAAVGGTNQTTWFAYTVNAANLLREGQNVIAVELHQNVATSTDLYLDFAMEIASAYRVEVPITSGMALNARACAAGEWSALAGYATDPDPVPNPYPALRVSKLMYAPSKPTAAETAMNYVNDDFAWLELRNTGLAAIQMEGVTVSNGIDHTFQAYLLNPGARLILAKNPTAFPLRYAVPEGTPVIAWTKGNLSRSGETLVFTDPDGQHILTFTYSDAWYPETKNTGYCLVAIDLSAEESAWSTAAQWRPCNLPGGSPGAPDLRKPVVQAMRMSDAGALTFDTAALDGKVSVLYSHNLIDWALCPDATFRVEANSISIDTKNEAFGTENRCFFVIRVEE